MLMYFDHGMYMLELYDLYPLRLLRYFIYIYIYIYIYMYVWILDFVLDVASIS